MAKKKLNETDINELEDRFLNIYINNGYNGTAAYKLTKPGCADTTARTEAAKMLAKPNIQYHLEIKKLARRNRELVDVGFLVQNLITIVNDCMTEGTERDTTGRITSKADRQSAIKAMDLLAKMGGHYSPQKMDVNLSGEVTNKIIKVSFKKPDCEE